MTNIISIDFDICMWQDIQIYNDSITSNKRDSVDRLVKTMPLLGYVRFDAHAYQSITNLLMEAKAELGADKIFFITDHEEILKYLPKDKEFNLYNLDHHHDMGYEEKLNARPQCGDWVCHAYKKYPMKKYYWVTDELSIDPDSDKIKEYPMQKLRANPFSFKNLIPETDKIIVCLSPTWVPTQFHPFFHLWQDLILT